VPVTSQQLVSVVIPAYNGAPTIDETLTSVRSQTHRALEIIVVDDGSTDDTRRIAEQHAAADERIQVVHQANAGVATARNAGWHRARSDFIAFIDADDLWAPTKIEKQLQALLAGGEHAGLAYCWTARIDAQGLVFRLHGGARHEGHVLENILQGNFVGCGSTVLVRRQTLIYAEGFDCRLRAAGAEGCEDWLFSCRVAERYHYVVVPEFLVGYRYLPDNMSSDRARMLRSHMMQCEEMLARHACLRKEVRRGLRGYSHWLMRDLALNGPARELVDLWLTLLRDYPSLAMRLLLWDLPLDPVRGVRDALRRRRHGQPRPATPMTGRPFLEGQAD
jgi:glycosyltransferase involved in cell wall biosynthesis